MPEYIKSPLNYTGGKYKILKHIIPCFPEKMGQFVDLFAGGLNVGVNVSAETIYVNDQITYLIGLYKFFQETDIDTLLSSIKSRIEFFGLSKSNLEGYNRLRLEYNKNKSLLDLFVLTCYSFNHQIRFNSKYEFNTSFGKDRSSWNNVIEQNLINFCSSLHSKNIIFYAMDFREFDMSRLNVGDVVYCDPPYYISTGPYNDGKRGFDNWTEKEDSDLFDLLDGLNDQGIYFALSNVFMHKGQFNNKLIEWSRKYRVTFIDGKYSNCNYHLKDRSAKTIEVLVTNY